MSAVGENDAIARRLEEAAQMLAEQRANPWRVQAYERVAGIRDALAGRLGRVRRSFDRAHGELPDVAELLDVDAEYRRGAERDALPRIAPRRFNPRHEAWLPVLHTQRGERHYTALYSNTARAHEAGRTRDWVVLYFDTADGERQCTVVTAPRGPMRGRRVVRGREQECERYHAPAG